VPRAIRVLHVDDDPELGDLTATHLEREDDRFAVRTATGAAEGLDSIEARPPDCVVSDYDMPGQDGIEFLRSVREERPELPFILFTGKGSEEVASDAIGAGATDYLQKGSGTDQYGILANRIGNAVEQYRSNRRAANLERVRELGSEVNQALVRASSTEGIETRVCELISGSEPYVAACIAGVDRGTMAVEPRAWAGDTTGYFEELDMAIDGDSPGRHAPEGRAFHDRDIAVAQDIREDEGYARWRERALQRGFRSLAAVPIDYEGESHGLLLAFAGRPDAFDRTERDVLTELASDIGHALHSQSLRMELERTNAELNSIMRHVPVGLILVEHADGEFRHRRFNRRMAELTGLPRGEMRDGTLREALGPEVGAGMVDRYRECVERGEPIAFTSESEVGGERAIREGVVSPVADDGDIEQLVVVVRDITDRKRREQELRRKERRYQSILDDPNFLAGVLDTDGRLLEANETAMSYIDAEPEDVVGEPFWETPWWSEEFRPVVRERIERAASGEYAPYETDLTTHDGEPYSVTGVIRPVTDADGRVVSLVVSARDITERERRERELGELTSQYAALVEHFPDGGVFLFDADLRYVRAGGDELSEVGLSSADFDGRTPHDLFPEPLAEETARYYRATLDGERHTFRQQYQGEDYEVRTMPIRDDTGAILYGMAVSRNITRQVERKRELERQNERLEEFAGVVSHDLRNPLRAAEGRLELARAECDCGSTHLDAAVDAIDRSRALIEDLLTLARGGDAVGTTEPVSLSALAEECWMVVPGAEATLTVATSRTVPADRGRLRQLLENLLANSVEHGDGAVTVTVGDLPGGFYVEDDGPGIPEGKRADAFEAGYSTAEDGTGFGLRIVEQIVDAHGWDIHVTEGASGGARIEITGVETGAT